MQHQHGAALLRRCCAVRCDGGRLLRGHGAAAAAIGGSREHMALMMQRCSREPALSIPPHLGKARKPPAMNSVGVTYDRGGQHPLKVLWPVCDCWSKSRADLGAGWRRRILHACPARKRSTLPLCASSSICPFHRPPRGTLGERRGAVPTARHIAAARGAQICGICGSAEVDVASPCAAVPPVRQNAARSGGRRHLSKARKRLRFQRLFGQPRVRACALLAI